MEELTIDPEKKDDAYYRYKMPALQIKVEGSGNGIKTVIPNIADIAAKLNRDPEYPMKYFGSDLGTNFKFEDSKWIVMGQHEKARLQKSLYDFICKFVLCKACRNPETKTLIDSKKKTIWLRCGACGRDTECVNDKTSNTIIKKELLLGNELRSADKKAGKKEKSEKVKKDKSKKDKESRSTTQRNPITLLVEFLEDDPSIMEIISFVAGVNVDYGLKEQDTVRLISEAYFRDEKFVKIIEPNADVFKRFVAPETEKHVISTLEVFVASKPELINKFPMALKKLYDFDIISEESIMKWASKPPKKVEPEVAEEIREKTAPFLDWLKQGSEDEEED